MEGISSVWLLVETAKTGVADFSKANYQGRRVTTAGTPSWPIDIPQHRDRWFAYSIFFSDECRTTLMLRAIVLDELHENLWGS